MIRIVIDTNVFVAAAYNSRSASRQIVNAVREKKLSLVVSPAIMREYEMVFPKAIRSDEAREEVWKAIECAESVTPHENPAMTEDRSDDKFLAAAVAGEADTVVTNDEHLLAVHPYEGIEILRPSEFLKWLSKKRRLTKGGRCRMPFVEIQCGPQANRVVPITPRSTLDHKSSLRAC